VRIRYSLVSRPRVAASCRLSSRRTVSPRGTFGIESAAADPSLCSTADDTHRSAHSYPSVLDMSGTRSTGGEGRRRLRCRIGLHRWVQIRHVDPDLEDPGQEVVLQTACRYCGAERGSGVAFQLGFAGLLAVGGVLLWLLVSAVLGALLVLGAVLGLGWAARMAWLNGYNSRLGFRYRS